MIYFKDSTNAVYAYPKSDLAQVEYLSELEKQLENISVAYSDAEKLFQQTSFLLNDAKNQLDIAIENEEPEEITRQLINDIEVKNSEYEKALLDFNQLSDKQEKIKIEHDSFLPVFYQIREDISAMKKMTPKEVDAHLNPPISKEQLVAEAEQERQSLILQASDVIAPLQDAIDLDIATEEENAQLLAWKKYRVLLNRVDTSRVPDIEWPQKPS